eukprot:15475234-Alexandrium_andersonii.AAC.1
MGIGPHDASTSGHRLLHQSAAGGGLRPQRSSTASSTPSRAAPNHQQRTTETPGAPLQAVSGA